LAGGQPGSPDQQFHKAAVAAKTTGHPEKSTTAVAVHQTAKPKPAAKLEKIPKAPHANTTWCQAITTGTATTGNGTAAIGLITMAGCQLDARSLERALVGLDLGSRLLVLSAAQA